MPSKSAKEIQWPHAPLRELSACGTYFVTAGTYRKQPYFRRCDRLEVLHRRLLAVTRDFGWHLEAWAVFSNHHFIAHAPDEENGARSLSGMLGLLHEKTAKWLNGLDDTAVARSGITDEYDVVLE